MSLNRCGKDLAANALQLLTDGDLPAAEVDVVPVQGENFAKAQTIEHEQQKGQVQRI